MSSAKSKGSANWISLSLPFWKEFQTTPRPFRAELLDRISKKVGKAPNTVYRQLVALTYLLSKGLDLDQLALNYPPLMSVEAIARVGKKDPRREDELLRRLLAGEGSVASFRSAADDLFRPSSPHEVAHQVTLSQILQAYLFPQSARDSPNANRASLGPGFSIAPLHEPHQQSSLVVRQGFPGRRTAILIADSRDPLSHARDFDALFEATVLRAVVTCDHVIVVKNLRLTSFERTFSAMKPEFRGVISVVEGDPVIDVTLPYGDERFATLADFLEKQTIRPA
ncbi:hypothetical protein [Bosea sp. TAF32]|uniref:hypothetical protein n=1 Tax=Bosea sp. TAF32 TaxID=3237482 RepID=UPI003F9353B7